MDYRFILLNPFLQLCITKFHRNWSDRFLVKIKQTHRQRQTGIYIAYVSHPLMDEITRSKNEVQTKIYYFIYIDGFSPATLFRRQLEEYNINLIIFF